MPVRDDFTPSVAGARMKVERAAEHRRQFNDELIAFLKQEPYRTVREVDADGPHYRLETNRALPQHLSVVVGDCLQNFRIALDYLAWQCALRAHSSPDRRHASFPIVPDSEAWRSRGDYQCRDCGKDAMSLIQDLQPYSRLKTSDASVIAHDPLWALNELARIDRHQVAHPTAVLIPVGDWSGFMEIPRIGNVPIYPELATGFFVTAPIEVEASEGGWHFDTPPSNFQPDTKVKIQRMFDISFGDTAKDAADFRVRQGLEAIEEGFRQFIIPRFEGLFHEVPSKEPQATA